MVNIFPLSLNGFRVVDLAVIVDAGKELVVNQTETTSKHGSTRSRQRSRSCKENFG
jgi:hypothetical protein